MSKTKVGKPGSQYEKICRKRMEQLWNYWLDRVVFGQDIREHAVIEKCVSLGVDERGDSCIDTSKMLIKGVAEQSIGYPFDGS